MTGSRHRGDPSDKPTRAQLKEYYRTTTQRAAARNSMTVAEYEQYASKVGTRTHPLWQPARLLSLSVTMTLILGFILVLAGIQWVNNGENLLGPIWFIVLILVLLCGWSWQMTIREYRAAAHRKRDGITLMPEGHGSVDLSPDPGGPVV